MRMTDRDEDPAMTTPRRRETRERLLDAAFEVFTEEGLRGASVEQICNRAGFTRGAFYSNFSSKEELFLALLGREFTLRTESLEAKAEEISPELRARSCALQPTEVARYVAEFFLPSSEATAWNVLETEFLLLAMRDPSIAPGYAELMAGVHDEIALVVERVVAAGGRRFTLPVERAVPVLAGVFEQSLRVTAIAGPGAHGGMDELGARITELLFAITEEIPA